MFSKLYKLLIAVLLMGVLVSACAPASAGSNNTSGNSQVVAGNNSTQAIPATGSVQITGAGATFPYPLYSRWFYDYAFVDTSVKFNYQAIGSGGGIQQITSKTVDFGASDAILSDEQLKAAPSLQMFPTVAGAEAIVVNLKGADGKPLSDSVKFTPDVLAGIFLGKITKWNDPTIASANSNLQLPAKDIIVVHRSDGSGTTYIFTDYLSSVSSDWKQTVGKGTSVKWPVGLGGKGNEGVYGTVSQNEGAIGYVELAYAIQNKAVLNQIQNKSGTFVTPSIPATQAALADFGTDMGSKLAISIVNAPGKDSYPIAGYTYILMYMDQQDCAKAQNLVKFFKWAYSAAGDKDASDLQYVPLPEAVKSQVTAKLAQITCQGKPLAQ
jgi:phosphate transport system substrate-binding protein